MFAHVAAHCPTVIKSDRQRPCDGGLMATSATTPRWASEYPELGFDPLPVEPLISPRYYELEKERIFRRVWLNVGTIAADCPNPGDYFVKEIEVCDASVLVMHGKDGQIRAFYNVCSHRG